MRVHCGLRVHLIKHQPALIACLGDSVILERCKPEEWCQALAEDFLQLFALLPLSAIKLDMDVDPRVTCSDASEEGGGVCQHRPDQKR